MEDVVHLFGVQCSMGKGPKWFPFLLFVGEAVSRVSYCVGVLRIILPCVLYGCETWLLTLKEERKLKVLENRVLRRTVWPKRDEVTRGVDLNLCGVLCGGGQVKAKRSFITIFDL
jgi:hypothetical protein